MRQKLLEEERRDDSDESDNDVVRSDLEKKTARMKRRRRRRTDEDLSEGCETDSSSYHQANKTLLGTTDNRVDCLVQEKMTSITRRFSL